MTNGVLPGPRSLGNPSIAPFFTIRHLRATRRMFAVSFPSGAEELQRVETDAREWAARLRKRVDQYAALYDAEPVSPTLPADAVEVVGQLAQLRAATFDVEQALAEILGTAPVNCAAWRSVRMLLDVFVASEDLRMGVKRRKADGSPRQRRPLGAACRKAGVSEHAVLNQINRARRRGRQQVR